MTAYHKKIIKYMELKGELAGDGFFVDHDRQAIEKWPSRVAEYIWRSLEDHIKLLNKTGISPWTCPFCIMHYYDECNNCEWSRTHRPCKYKTSDVHKIKNLRKFTNNFYRSILKEAGKS